MEQHKIAPHEAIQLHELLTFKNLCLTKSITMNKLVSDVELKDLMQQDAALTQQHIQELRGLMNKTAVAVSEN